jgi:hypothetical protein
MADQLDRLRTTVASFQSRDVQSRWARPALAYEAYEAYGEGLKAYLRQEHTEATRQFERAVAADTAFTRAKLWAALSSQIAGRIIDR